MKAIKYCLIALYGFILLGCSEENDEEPKDPCLEVTCNEPYEVAVATASTVCQCTCAPGFSGPDCKDFDEGNCEYVQCQNGGSKLQDGEYCFCSCPDGWGGPLCEIPLGICSGIECPEGQSPNPEKDCLCE